MKNRGIVRRFFGTYREVARDGDAPLWLLILGMPFVAILVLLDDYAWGMMFRVWFIFMTEREPINASVAEAQ